MKRDPPFNVRTARVCSQHFTQDDFLKNIASGRSILREGAVPSVFTFRKPKKTRKPPKPRTIPVDPKRSRTAVSEVETRPPPQTLDAEEDTSMSLSPAASAESRSPAESEKDTEILRLRLELQQAHERNTRLEARVSLLQKRCAYLENASAEFSVEKYKDSDEDFQFYTGLPCYGKFKKLLQYLKPHDVSTDDGGSSRREAGRPTVLSAENQLFLVLVCLRLGLFQKDLGHRFNVHQSTVSRIFNEWVNLMFHRLGDLPMWPSRHVVDKHMPKEFMEKHSHTRVIIDATEIKCEVPSSFVLQSETYSNYKSANTFKGLVGVSPDGTLTFVSGLFTGCVSDRELVKCSGLLSRPFDKGDVVMADKGFTIKDLLEPIGVHLNMPPFLRNGQFSEDDVAKTEEIASLRIHVERRIQRIKSFHIFDRRIPITIAPLANQIWTVCALLTNYQTPLMKPS
ncbi:uncharacterized protein LOC144173312 [Haemaphysalis longicornis]